MKRLFSVQLFHNKQFLFHILAISACIIIIFQTTRATDDACLLFYTRVFARRFIFIRENNKKRIALNCFVTRYKLSTHYYIVFGILLNTKFSSWPADLPRSWLNIGHCFNELGVNFMLTVYQRFEISVWRYCFFSTLENEYTFNWNYKPSVHISFFLFIKFYFIFQFVQK